MRRGQRGGFGRRDASSSSVHRLRRAAPLPKLKRPTRAPLPSPVHQRNHPLPSPPRHHDTTTTATTRENPQNACHRAPRLRIFVVSPDADERRPSARRSRTSIRTRAWAIRRYTHPLPPTRRVSLSAIVVRSPLLQLATHRITRTDHCSVRIASYDRRSIVTGRWYNDHPSVSNNNTATSKIVGNKPRVWIARDDRFNTNPVAHRRV